ncbi:hypothetical protein [Streptosporangium jomthongense]|uniref:Uncharacterized protein n=1 Tax=Streptosporangium jomthongense TaxID=1193683 RepID=A0ABV8F7H5_9ACTN
MKKKPAPFTDEALAALADTAAQFLIAQADGDRAGAQAEINKAAIIRDNPTSRKK